MAPQAVGLPHKTPVPVTLSVAKGPRAKHYRPEADAGLAPQAFGFASLNMTRERE